MRAPLLRTRTLISEPNSTLFPTHQVPQQQESATMGGHGGHSGPPPQPVQQKIIARATRGMRADPPSPPHGPSAALSVISGSGGDAVAAPSSAAPVPSTVKLQSVNDNCLLNYVTVPNKQRKMVAHNNNNSSTLDDSCKFGALPYNGLDIPPKKADDDNDDDEVDIGASKGADNDDDFKRDMRNLLTKVRTIFDDLNTTPLRLRGGGESSLSTGTSGWGTPPSQPANNNNMNNTSGWGTANPTNPNNTGTQQWNNNANRPPGASPSDANKGTPGQPPATPQPNNAVGWGPSGQSGAKPPQVAPATTSAPANNNGQNPIPNNTSNSTKQQLEQLNNMREAIFSTDGWGGQHVNQDTQWDIPTSPEPAIKMDGSGPPPWKPAVNNGTELWEANLRNGGQPPPQPQQKTPWGHTPSTNIGGTWGEDDDATESSNVWTGVPNNQQQWGNNNSNPMWGGAAAGNAGGWGDPRAPDPRAAAAAAAVAAMDGMRPDLRAAAAASGLDPRQLDPREQMRQMAGGDMRGDSRGITGRLGITGNGAEFWNQGPHAAGPGGAGMHHQNKMPGVGPGSAAGWEEPSPPTQRRNMPNYDDGTSLWGNPQQGAMGRGGNGGGGTGPPGMAPGRKPEGVWSGNGAGRNGWDDVAGPPSASWGEEQVGPWNKQKGPGLWDTPGLDDWHKPQNKPQLTKEQVWNSRQFKMLVDMGYKKEDVENALRMRDMNTDEALDFLSSIRGGRGNNEGWAARHDDHYDHNHFPNQRGYPGIGGPGGNPIVPGGFPGNAPGLLNNQANSSLINNISPAGVQKLLTQQGGQNYPGGPGGGRPMQPQGQPSTQQLRMLVTQIQMAVQAGYLNHQILNQPLAPHTLVLLNQLLQQIKLLQQYNNQHQIAAQGTKNSLTNQTLLQLSVAITKTKQQIMNIQNQIQAQQAVYVKQQQQNQGMGYDFKPNPMHDTINSLPSNFADLAIKDPGQQSRLNQWINKDKDDGDFSRAPGSSSKPIATSPGMGPLGLTQPDGPWSTGRSGDTGGWPDSASNVVVDASNDVKDAQSWATAAQPSLTDLVPEFEPGKPWKIKSIEDDPSITPGSVVRSPLSIATINVKDNELFGINTSKSPPATDALQPLSSSTWSFNPPSTSSAFTSSPQIKLPTSKGGLDLNPGTAVTSELWAAPKSRGPPPGLGGGKGGGVSNGWSSQPSWAGTGAAVATAAVQRNSGNWGGSSSQWLLLRNLTAQIDGSTLRTLCMQHGPLLKFHLHLHQGFALAMYSTREEATKAQTTLNNCVLSNTTILAENPTDWDADILLQGIANQQSSSSGGGWRNTASKPSGGNTWGDTWSTPSSLSTFLPNDLLNGESM